MDERHRIRIVGRHRDSLKRYGYGPNALYWSSREIQEIRFRILSEIGIESGDSVLDVGCGFGDFLGWSAAQGLSIDYTGIDLSPDLLEVAIERHPGSVFRCCDLVDFCHAHADFFDWVILSGALNEQLGDAGDYARRVITLMWSRSLKGTAFNLLDARHAPTRACWDLQSHDPATIQDFVERLTPDHRLVDGYLANDFTIYLRRE
ncbi:MAG: methyltransferase domain-containing protein [Gammaproteobacteria bacterium]|nr:methyltransferase domain-containing protein [Gammaproteobacteria bacterium]